MKFNFKTLIGKTYKIDGFSPSDTIEQLKLAVVPYLKNEYCITQINLIIIGRGVINERTIRDYNIIDDSTIHVIMRFNRKIKCDIKY